MKIIIPIDEDLELTPLTALLDTLEKSELGKFLGVTATHDNDLGESSLVLYLQRKEATK